jgi:hypothetical protein
MRSNEPHARLPEAAGGAGCAALRCAQINVDEARRQFNFQRDQDLAEHSLGLMSAAIGEVRQGLREALELTERPLLLPPARER